MPLPVVGVVVRLVGGGIGMASEAYQGHKQAKAIKAREQAQEHGSDIAESSAAGGAHQVPDDPPPEYVETSEEHAAELISKGHAVPVTDRELDKHGYPRDSKKKMHHDDDDDDSDDDSDEDISDHDDEAEWALDDAAEAADPPSYEEISRQISSNKLVEQVLQLATPLPGKRVHIAAPVILPQRRPRDKTRGFVRAYSPVLQDVGISQDCFLTFTKNFYSASQASPWLNVVMLGAAIAGFVPEMAAQISSAVVQVCVGTAQELQRRHRTNTFLDTMNQELFMPRGLYAMIVTYKPEATKAIDAQQLDVSAAVARYASHDSGKVKETLKDLRLSSGKTHGQLEFPKAAPLIYPALDEAAFGGDENKQNVLKGTGNFMADYLDRRAQAKYMYRNPNSAIEYEQPQFANRFSDPNSAVNSGSWIALITGGAYDPRARRQAKRDRKTARRNAKRAARGKPPRPQRLPKSQREPKGLVRRALRKDVLYLLIVDLPSEEEIAAARAKLKQLHDHESSIAQR